MYKKLSKMMKIWTLLLLLSSAYAQTMTDQAPEEEVSAEYFKKYLEEPRLSKKYIRGANLVYDCEFKHFACVNKDSNNDCNKENKCIKIKSLESQKECFELHKSLQEKTKITSYCKTIL